MQASLRRRLLYILLLASFGTWLIAATASYFDSRHEIEQLFDAELAHVANVLLTLSNHELGEEILFRGTSKTLEMPSVKNLSDRYATQYAFQVWLSNGTLALRSASAPLEPLAKQANNFSMTEFSGVQWRVFSLSDPATGITVRVGELYKGRSELAGNIATRILTLIIIAVAIVGLLTWFGVGRALRPLVQLAEQVRARSPFDFSPIATARALRETAPLLDSFNSLLARLERAFSNERCFTSNAAHELRTPLAGLAAQNEVALAAVSDEVRIAALSNVREGIGRMSNLVQQLLALARLDDLNPAMAVRTRVPLHSLINSLLREFTATAQRSDITLKSDCRGNTVLFGIESALALMIRNIVDNAFRHTPRNGLVEILLSGDDRELTLRVVDSGPGIPAEEIPFVFQRFYRSGHADMRGAGLGLSIVQRCAELHDARIELKKSAYGGLDFCVSFPRRARQRDRASKRRDEVPATVH
jgi:two-component system sensor histidine kinase QseC